MTEMTELIECEDGASDRAESAVRQLLLLVQFTCMAFKIGNVPLAETCRRLVDDGFKAARATFTNDDDVQLLAVTLPALLTVIRMTFYGDGLGASATITQLLTDTFPLPPAATCTALARDLHVVCLNTAAVCHYYAMGTPTEASGIVPLLSQTGAALVRYGVPSRRLTQCVDILHAGIRSVGDPRVALKCEPFLSNLALFYTWDDYAGPDAEHERRKLLFSLLEEYSAGPEAVPPRLR